MLYTITFSKTFLVNSEDLAGSLKVARQELKRALKEENVADDFKYEIRFESYAGDVLTEKIFTNKLTLPKKSD